MPLKPNPGPVPPLYAPAEQGGGGGGVDPVVSTITIETRAKMAFGAADSSAGVSFYKDSSFTTYANMKYDGAAGISSLAVYDAPGGNPGNLFLGNLTVSSINGAAPGGGVGPNPVFSTVIVSTTLVISNDAGSPNDGGIVWTTQAGTTQDVGLGLNGIGGGGQYGNSVMTFWTAIDPVTGVAGPGEVGAQRVYLEGGANMDNKAYIERTSTNGHLSLVAPNIDLKGQVGISSLNVSSINGAAPGGGGGAPPTFVSTISSIFNLSSINSGSPGLLTVVGSLLATDYLGAGQVSTASVVSIVPGGAVSIQNLGTSSISSAAPQINMTAPVGMSSLVVSSINGAAPGGGSSASFSTLYSGSSTITCDGGVTTTLLNFGTTVGHTYQIQTQMNIQGNGGQEGTLDDDVVQEVVAQLFLNATQGSFISTANAAARDVNIGTCGMWKATQGAQALAINGTFSTQVVMTGVSLLDYGAI